MPAPPGDPLAVDTLPMAQDDVSPCLWLVDLAASGPALLALEEREPRLSDDDAQHASRADAAAVAAGGLAERRAAYVALRLVIEATAGRSLARRPFVRTPAGRPHVDATVDFSLSHTQGFALVGVVRQGRIGVDVERLRPLRMAPARRAAIEAAGAALAPDEPLPATDDLRTLAAWVRIEAFAKAHAVTVARVLTAVGALGGAAARGGSAPRPVAPADVTAATASLADPSDGGRPPRAMPLDLPGDLLGAVCWRPGSAAAAAPGVLPGWAALPGDREGLDRLAAAGRDGR